VTQVRSALSVENALSYWSKRSQAGEKLVEALSGPVGFKECVAGVRHSDLLPGNRHVTQGDHVRASAAFEADRLARSLSSGL
jgi:hypothetical protein